MNVPEAQALGGALSDLEQMRRARLMQMAICLSVVVVLVVVAAVYFSESGGSVAVIASLVVGSIVGFGILSGFIGSIRREFKRKIVPILLWEIDPSLSYAVSEYVPEADFNACHLYMAPDRYSGKDLVEGYIGETAVRFSLVHAEEEYQDTDTDSEGHTTTRTHYRTIFKGLLFIADFNKEFSGRTLVKPRGVSLLSKLFGTHVDLEDPEFNGLFSVSATDQVEARYILTPSMMERLKSVHVRMGSFRAAFSGGCLYMTIEVPWDTFEPTVTRSLMDSDQIEKIRANISAVTRIVEDIGLNVRIWTKTGGKAGTDSLREA